jgi:phage FluMu protein Com
MTPQDYRCPNDNKLLFKGLLIDSTIEVKCKHCKQIVVITGESKDKWVCTKVDCQNRQV